MFASSQNNAAPNVSDTPITKGLVCAPLFTSSGYDPARRRPLYGKSSGVSVNTGKYGLGYKGNGSNAGIQLSRSGGLGFGDIVPDASPFTVMIFQRTASTGTRRVFFSDSIAAGTTRRVIFEEQAAGTYRFRIITSGGATVTVTGGTVATGWHWAEAVHDGVNLEAFIDGTSIGTAACSLPRGQFTATTSACHYLRNGDSTTLASDGTGVFIAIWGRVLTAKERASVRKNPWQIYASMEGDSHIAYVTPAGGGATAINLMKTRQIAY